MTKNQAGVMAYIAIRAMWTIPTLASVINKIEARDGGNISTQPAYSHTQISWGETGVHKIPVLLKGKEVATYRESLMT